MDEASVGAFSITLGKASGAFVRDTRSTLLYTLSGRCRGVVHGLWDLCTDQGNAAKHFFAPHNVFFFNLDYEKSTSFYYFSSNVLDYL